MRPRKKNLPRQKRKVAPDNRIFMARQQKKAILLATLGFPGSGKTFFSRRFAKERGFFHLNSDRVRGEIFSTPVYNKKENDAVFRAMDYIAEELLSRGVSVIYDANSTRRAYRRDLQRLARKQQAGYLLLWFRTPVNVAIKRIKKRNELKRELLKKYHQPIDLAVLFRIRRHIEEPKAEPYLALDGTAPYADLARETRRVIGLRQDI